MSASDDHTNPLSPKGEAPAPVDAQTWAAYQAGALDGPEKAAVEARLAWMQANLDADPNLLHADADLHADPDADYDALAGEGLAQMEQDLGASGLAELEAAMRKDIGILSEGQDEPAAGTGGGLQRSIGRVSGGAGRNTARNTARGGTAAGGRIRQLRPLRMAVAAIMVGVLAGGLYLVTRWVQQPDTPMAMDRPAQQAPERNTQRPEAATEALPLEDALPPDENEDEIEGQSAAERKALDNTAGDAAPSLQETADVRSQVRPGQVRRETEEASAASASNSAPVSPPPPPPAPELEIVEEDTYLDMEELAEELAFEFAEPNMPEAEESEPVADQFYSADALPSAADDAAIKVQAHTLSAERIEAAPIAGGAPNTTAASSTAGSAQLQGQVLDADGQPIPFANVLLEGTSIGAVTDMDGRFNLKAPEGEYQARVQYVGHQNLEARVDLKANRTEQVAWTLAEDAVALESVEITSTGRSQRAPKRDRVQDREKDRKQEASRVDQIDGALIGKSATDSAPPATDPGDPPSGVPASSASGNGGPAAPMVQYSALLERAAGQRQAGDPVQALETLAAFPNGASGAGGAANPVPEREADGAVLLRAQCYLDLEQPATAENLLRPLAGKPDGSFYDAARFHLAEALWAQDQAADARTLWQNLAYGNGPWALQARERLEALDK